MRQPDIYKHVLYEKCDCGSSEPVKWNSGQNLGLPTVKNKRKQMRVSFRGDSDETVGEISAINRQHSGGDDDKHAKPDNVETIEETHASLNSDDTSSLPSPKSPKLKRDSSVSIADTETSDITMAPSFGRKRPPKLSRMKAVQSLDFDQLFEHPDQFSASIRRQTFNKLYESVDDGIASLEIDVDESPTSRDSLPEIDSGYRSSRHSSSVFTRTDSVFFLTFKQILERNVESSKGFTGFRHRIGNDVNFKYCSYCRCDEVLFLFLYTVFGIVYICAGCLGLYNCPSELFINIYLIVDGLFSIFIFPTTIMEWTKRIGGCVKEEDKLGSGVFFIIVLVLRTAAGVLGTVILVMRFESIPNDNVMCLTISTLLHVGVALEWTFLLFGIVLPTCLYSILYYFAKRSLLQKHSPFELGSINTTLDTGHTVK